MPSGGWVDGFINELRALAGPHAIPAPTSPVVADEIVALRRRVAELERELARYQIPADLGPPLDLDDPAVMAELCAGELDCALGSLDADCAELEEYERFHPGPREITAAIERAAWQYGECSGLRIAAALLRKGYTDWEREDFALTVNQNYLDPDNSWENIENGGYDCNGLQDSGSTTFEASYRYLETSAFDDVRSLGQLPADCTDEHYDRVRQVLYWRNVRMYGTEDRRAKQYEMPRVRKVRVYHRGAARRTLQRAKLELAEVTQ